MTWAPAWMTATQKVRPRPRSGARPLYGVLVFQNFPREENIFFFMTDGRELLTTPLYFMAGKQRPVRIIIRNSQKLKREILSGFWKVFKYEKENFYKNLCALHQRRTNASPFN